MIRRTTHSVGSLAALVGLTLFAGATNAAQVSVQGSIARQANPTPDVLGLDRSAGAELSVAGSFRGLIAVQSQLAGDRQIMRVVLSDVTLTTSGKTDELVRVSIVQDFAARMGAQIVGGPTSPASPQTTVTEASPKHSAQHESMAIAAGVTLPDTRSILEKDHGGASSANAPEVSLVQLRDGVFRLTATYQFALPRGSTSGTFLIGEKDGVNTQVVLVPLPPAAWAGLGGLALVAGSHARRRWIVG